MEHLRCWSAGGQPFVACSACRSWRAVRLPRHRALLRHPTPRASTGTLHDPNATLRSWLRRHGPSTTGGSGRVSQRPCRRLGSQSRPITVPLARRSASRASVPPAQRPRQLHRTTDRNRGHPIGCGWWNFRLLSPPTEADQIVSIVDEHPGGCCGATWDSNWPAGQWPTGHRVRSCDGHWVPSHIRTVTRLPVAVE